MCSDEDPGTVPPAAPPGRPDGVSRRGLLRTLGVTGLAATGLGMLTGCDTGSPSDGDPDDGATMLADVDPMIGTATPGNTYPGAHLPFGFAAASPDTEGPSSAGYSTTGRIIGFSQTHVSGTGGESRYGNVRVTPLTGSVRLTGLASGRADERAEPGYYSVRLTAPNVLVELTATRRCAVHRYTFPHDGDGHLLIDASSVIDLNDSQTARTSEIRLLGRNRFEGTVTVTGGWGDRGGEYTLHFAGQFDRSFSDFATFVDDRITRGFREVTGGSRQRVGAVVTVPTTMERAVEMRVAVSFLSTDQAHSTLDSEIGIRGFNEIRDSARRRWRDALSRITVRGGTAEQRAVFATALYHCQLMPHDLTGENVWWNSDTPHYEDFYTLWDTSRCLHPLLTLIQPGRQSDMVSSLVETYQHTGWLPDARIAGANCFIQGGTNGDVLVADALVKKLPGVDYRTAYRALRQDGEHNSPRPQVEGRELDDYLRLGYLPVNPKSSDDPHGDRSASRTLEYALGDFCINQVARHFGDTTVADRYLRRSLNWVNLWDNETRLIRPRHSDGGWLSPFDPDDAGTPHFYEGSAYQYTTFVPHDVRGLILRMGGDGAMVAYLDALFDKGRYNAANEPDMQAPYLYLHAGRPDRAADITRRLLAEQYGTGPDGLPGNDDAGAMSAWYVWTALGLYPNAGHSWYYLSSPLFPDARIRLSGDRSLRIRARGASETNRYVQSVHLNGRPVNGPWIQHADLVRGGTLEFVLGRRPSRWGRSHRPPSVTVR
ncbi:MAG: GH92 family glycosyl hydrolase [Actinocatenispora sp.]